jgi:hypothetical protein
MKCVYCRSSHMRLSRIRLSDFPWFLVLQIPVRCHTCFERVHASVFSAWNLALAKRRVRKNSRIARGEGKIHGDSTIA